MRSGCKGFQGMPLLLILTFITIMSYGCDEDASESLVVQNDEVGVVYLLDGEPAVDCRFEPNQLTSQLKIIVQKAKNKELSPLRVILHAEHPLVKDNTKFPALKVQSADNRWWYIPLNDKGQLVFLFDKNMVAAYEYPKALHVSCEL